MSQPGKYSLTPKFDGTIKELLRYRFGLVQSSLNSLFASNEGDRVISLPGDYGFVVDIFKQHQSLLAESVKNSKKTYLDYLENVGFEQGNEIPVVPDVGYPATQQSINTIQFKKQINKENYSDISVLIVSGKSYANLQGQIKKLLPLMLPGSLIAFEGTEGKPDGKNVFQKCVLESFAANVVYQSNSSWIIRKT